MQRVRLRHHQAEELIAKAKEQAELREQQFKKQSTLQGQQSSVHTRNQLLPPEISLLGYWQIIELITVQNVTPEKVSGEKLGNAFICFTTLTPEGKLFGKEISGIGSEMIVETGSHAGKPWPGYSTYELNGEIIDKGIGLIKYHAIPREGREFFTIGYGYVKLPMEVHAYCNKWEMSGKAFNNERGFCSEFKAVRLDDLPEKVKALI